MPPDSGAKPSRSVEHLCSPPSLGQDSWGVGMREADSARSRGGKQSRTEGFFLRSPSEGGSSKQQAQRAPRDGADQASGFVRAPSDGARQHRHRQTQSRVPALKLGKEADGKLSFDFAAALAQRPTVAYSGPLPQRTPDLWEEDRLTHVPRGTRTALERGTANSRSWVEARGKDTWQSKAKRWLLMKPAVRGQMRGSPTSFVSLIPLSDGALGMTLREQPEEHDSALTPGSRKALFCPSSQSFLESVSTSNW